MTRLYDPATARFFAPCTPESIRSLLQVTKNLLFIYETLPPADRPLIARAFMVFLVLLDYNLSNFVTRVDETTGGTLSFDLHDEILGFYLTEILGNPRFAIFHKLVGFSVVNSFGLLFSQTMVSKARMEYTPKIIVSLYRGMGPSWVRFMVSQLHLQSAFAYVISPQHCRDLFSQLLDTMVTAKMLELGIDYELLFCFMRSLMLEMKRVYSENPRELPPAQRALSDTFMAFASLISETAQNLFTSVVKPEDLDFQGNYFLRFVGRWLMLLEPFTTFSRAAIEAVSFLSPMFRRLLDRILAWNIPLFPADTDSFSPLVAFFLELFSLYADFINSLLDGGEEMKAAIKYN
jgi:hypothetical protein